MPSTNVVLVGMMGSGKSTVGRLVAERAGMEFVDLDRVIVDKARREIAEIFAQDGEDAFRMMETEALREVLGATNAVVATGGGAVTRAENRRIIREMGTVFWLDAPAEVLLDRIGDDASRPKLAGGDAFKRLVALQAERREHYADASHFHLDTSELTPDEIALRIEKELGIEASPAGANVFATIVAIDGPVGSGKSALARRVASRLNYIHVDTGAMYRCVTLEAIRRGVTLDDAAGLTGVSHSIDIRFQDGDGGDGATNWGSGTPQRVMLNGEDVTEAIRAPEISRSTSAVADVPTVRKELSEFQRQMALRGRSVLEGRDISTVVIPEARWKLYLTASLEERVQRRLKQYQSQGSQTDAGQVRGDIIRRDDSDRNRAHGALRLAADATIVDTTNMPLDEVVEAIVAMVRQA